MSVDSIPQPPTVLAEEVDEIHGPRLPPDTIRGTTLVGYTGAPRSRSGVPWWQKWQETTVHAGSLAEGIRGALGGSHRVVLYWRLLIPKQPKGPGLFQVPAHVVGQDAQQDVGLDALGAECDGTAVLGIQWQTGRTTQPSGLRLETVLV